VVHFIFYQVTWSVSVTFFSPFNSPPPPFALVEKLAFVIFPHGERLFRRPRLPLSFSSLWRPLLNFPLGDHSVFSFSTAFFDSLVSSLSKTFSFSLFELYTGALGGAGGEWTLALLFFAGVASPAAF